MSGSKLIEGKAVVDKGASPQNAPRPHNRSRQSLLDFGGLSDPTYWLIHQGNHVYNRTRRDAQTPWGTAPVLCVVPLRVGDIPSPPLPSTRGLVTLGTALDSGGAAGVEEVPGKKVEDTG